MNKGTAVIAILVAFVGGYFLGNLTGKGPGSAPGGIEAKGDSLVINDEVPGPPLLACPVMRSDTSCRSYRVPSAQRKAVTRPA